MKMPIPTDWDGTSFCRFAVCWPDSPLWRIILRGLLTEPTRGFFWDERTGSVIDVLADIRQTMDYNLELSEVIMACNDSGIAEAIQAVANAVITASINNSNSANASASGCCGDTIININGGIQGTVTQPVGGNSVPIYGTQPPVTVPPGELPDGFETQEEWDVDRCQVANGIIDGVISALKWFAALDFAQTVGLAALILAGIAGSIVLDPLMIPALMGALLLLATSTALLTQAADYLQDHREEWICWLMTGDSVGFIVSSLADGIDTLVSFLATSSFLGGAIKVVLLVLFNTDNLNKLMTKQAHALYPDADCSGCTPVACWEFTETVEDWTAGEEFPSFGPGGAYGSVSWTSDGGGMLRLTLQTSGDNQYGSIASPLFSHIIETGDYICVNTNAVNPAGSTNNYGGLLIDGVEVQWFTPLTGNAVGISAISLDPWVGQELQRVMLGYSRSNTTPNLTIDFASICLNKTPCP